MLEKINATMVQRFIDYCRVDTASDPESKTYPSTHKQYVFGEQLAEDLRALGLEDAAIDKYGYVTATIPSNMEAKVPTVGFIAHMDIISSVPTENIDPKVFRNYDGGDLLINPEKNIVLSPQDYPSLLNYIGQDIITSDGTTLLGGDDKAGIVEIMAMAEYLLAHPEVKHGDIKIGVTPDEEVGRGTEYFDVPAFGADFAYTIDGGGLGGINYETFNAASARIKINGVNIHPGSSKNMMKSAILIAMELNGMLPVEQRPAFTEVYEGFFHLNWVHGNVDFTEMNYIIRDHDRQKFEDKKAHMQRTVDFLNAQYGAGTIELEMKDSYRNMRDMLESKMYIVDEACEAMRQVGIEPKITPVRGGTDGARLSYMGLPCPNLFTGGYNAHGKMEYVVVQSMEKMVEVLLKIVQINAAKA